MKDLPDFSIICKQLSGNISALSSRFPPSAISGVLRYTSQHKNFARKGLAVFFRVGFVLLSEQAAE